MLFFLFRYSISVGQVWMNFDILDGDCGPITVYLNLLMKTYTADVGCSLPTMYLSQYTVYSKNELQSKLITFRWHHFDTYLYFSLCLLLFYFSLSFFSVSPSYDLFFPLFIFNYLYPLRLNSRKTQSFWRSLSEIKVRLGFFVLIAYQPLQAIQCQIHPSRTVVVLFNP